MHATWRDGQIPTDGHTEKRARNNSAHSEMPVSEIPAVLSDQFWTSAGVERSVVSWRAAQRQPAISPPHALRYWGSAVLTELGIMSDLAALLADDNFRMVRG